MVTDTGNSSLSCLVWKFHMATIIHFSNPEVPCVAADRAIHKKDRSYPGPLGG